MYDNNDDKLIESSPKMRGWLRELRRYVEARNPMLSFSAVRYWAKFSSVHRAVAQLQVRKNIIKLFLRLDPSADPLLSPSPNTGGWEIAFPSVFRLELEEDIPLAADFIQRSFLVD